MGLFDQTPEGVSQLQMQDENAAAMAMAQLHPGRVGVYAGSLGGQMLGRAAGGALGYEDPRMDQARRLQLAMHETEASGVDFAQDPAAYMQTASKFLIKHGLYEQAMETANKVNALSQGQLAQTQNKQALKKLSQADEAEQVIGAIMEAVGGDESEAEKRMRVHPNPLVQERGIELGKKRYLPFSGDLYDTQKNVVIKGTDKAESNPEIVKLQGHLTSAQAAIEKAKTEGQRPEYISALQKNADELQDRIKLLSEGRASSSTIERSVNRLQELQGIADQGKMTPELWREAQGLRSITEQKRLQVDPTSGKAYYVQPFELPTSITVGRGDMPRGPVRQPATQPTAPGALGVPTNTLPSLEGGRKPIDAGTETKLTNIGSGVSQLGNFSGNFKPEFGGFVSETAADLAIEAGRRGVDKYKPMANWWSEYRQWLTDMRAAKFGMTLTGYELQAFKQYTSNPGDSADVIQENLGRQNRIVNNAAQRELRAIQKSGQNLAQAEALAGVKYDPNWKDAYTSAPPTGAAKPAGKIPNSTQEQVLPDGKIRWGGYDWPNRQTLDNYKKATGGKP